ncbi:MAG TPA: hypothetical protein VF975_02535 [Thermoanaerobaculia bacterium]
MELALNVIWFAVAATSFVLMPKRSRLVWFALLATFALLFPVISVSDDLNADWAVNAAAALVAIAVLSVAFVAIARLRTFPAAVYAFHLSSPSDPRSPPAR